tara:strand:+ start:1094 stop:1690 length:597 start_codon:yes stop_codon:yes gene_type:complete
MKNRKTTLRKMILSAVMLTAMVSNATNELHTIPKNDLKETTFTLSYVKQGNKLIIKDLNGVVLYKEQIKDTGMYSKGFDLTSLPNGSYVFELEKDLEIKSYPFTVNSNIVAFNENGTTVHKPFVTFKDNYIYVSKLALNNEPLDIKIYYEDDSELIYSEKIKDTQTIQKVYKLDFNVKGNYKIVLKSDGKEYYEYINF